RIGFFAYGDAVLGKINTVHLARLRHCGQLADGSAAATTNIEDGVVPSHRDVLQAPVGQLRASGVHTPKREPAHPSGWLVALACAPDCSGHDGFPVRAVRPLSITPS